MLVNSKKMVSVAKLQRELTQKLKEVADSGDPVFVLRNNSLTAVIVSTEEYEALKQAEGILEHLEIAEVVQKRVGIQLDIRIFDETVFWNIPSHGNIIGKP